MNTFVQDIRYGLRALRRAPGFTLVAVLTLGVGIGANTAIFSAINAMLLRYLPVDRPEQIVGVYQTDKQFTNASEMSYPNLVDVRERCDAFSGLLGHKLIHVGVARGAENEIVWGELVTGNYFDVLGVAPELGRGFLPEEDRTPGSHPVAVISDAYWRRAFAADPGIAGKVVKVNGRDFTVVGVAPPDFHGTKFALALDVWVPMMMRDEVLASGGSPAAEVFAERGARWIQVLGRLAPGVTDEQARASLAVLGAQLEQENPTANAGFTFTAFPERDTRFGEDSRSGTKLAATFLLAVAAVVLLIACANVSNLLLARATQRGREIGIRMALGAGRGRIVRQLLTESALLAALGGAAGVLLALWLSSLFRAFVPPVPFPVSIDTTPDARVFAFSLVATIGASFVFGLAPALYASGFDILAILKGTGASTASGRTNRLRGALVVAQLAMSFVLLVGAGLFLRSLVNFQNADSGFDTKNLLFATVDVGLLDYDDARGADFFRRLVERVEALPGVRSATVADIVPLGDSHNSNGPLVAEGTTLERPEDGFNAGTSMIGTRHFETLGTPILEGRDFDATDTATSEPVVIVNEALAKRLWPDEDAVGKRFRVGGGDDDPLVRVVGVAKDAKYWSLSDGPRRYMYFPATQHYRSEMTLLVRTDGDPTAMAAPVRDAVRGLDPALPIYDVKSLDTHLAYSLWMPRMGAALAAIFGGVALLLAVVGLYGVMAYTVSQQTRDIGIRMALGAQAADVLRMVVRSGMAMTLLGMGIGLVLAIAATRALAGLLFGVSPADPLVYAGIVALLALVALVAVIVPARRATRVDPMVALRHE